MNSNGGVVLKSVTTRLSNAAQSLAATAGLAVIAGATIAGAATLAHAGAPSSAPTGAEFAAQPQDVTDWPLVSAEFDGKPIREALKAIEEQAGIKIVPDSTVNGETTVGFSQTPLNIALSMMLTPNNLVFRKIDGYILVGNTDPNGPSFLMLSETIRYGCSHVPPGRLINMLPQRLRGFCVPDEPSFTIAITAPPMIISRLHELFSVLDAEQRQIILRARIVEITEETRRDTGIDWNLMFGSPNSGTNTQTGAGFFDSLTSTLGLTYTATAAFTRQIDLALSLLAETRAASIIANPHITVIDGSDAEIRVLTEEYFKITSRKDAFGRGDLEKIASGVMLKVKPRIGADGSVTMTVSPEVSNVIARLNDGLPVVTRRTATTNVRVESGGTAVIGGLVSSIGSTEARKTPGIGDAPLLGGFFRRDMGEEVQRQFLIFITPTILDESLPPADLSTVEGGTIDVVLPSQRDDSAFRTELEKIIRERREK